MRSARFYRALSAQIVRLLSEERERQGLSKYALSGRSGVSQPMISYLERGLRTPSLEITLRLADAMNLDLGKLVKAAERSVSEEK